MLSNFYSGIVKFAVGCAIVFGTAAIAVGVCLLLHPAILWTMLKLISAAALIGCGVRILAALVCGLVG